MRNRAIITGIVVSGVIMATSGPVRAQSSTEDSITKLQQEVRDLQRQREAESAAKANLVVTGYAHALYQDVEGGDETFTFGSFNPIFLYRLGDNVLFEAELELDVEDDGDTGLELEYGQIDYVVNDYLTLIAGRFILPLGVFSEKLHPAWINKLPTGPLPYAGSGGHHDSILPFNDIGVQARGSFHPGDGNLSISYAIYAVNGPGYSTAAHDESADAHAAEEAPHVEEAPRVEEAPHAEEEAHAEEAPHAEKAILGVEVGHVEVAHEEEAAPHIEEAPHVEEAVRVDGASEEISFETGANANGSLSIGGRVAAFYPWGKQNSIELGVSGQTANWDSQDRHAWSAVVLDATLHAGPYAEMRGEYITTSQEMDAATIDPEGYWLQTALKLAALDLDLPVVNNTETVLRWSGVDKDVGAGTVSQFSVGLNYYVSSTLQLKAGYDFAESGSADQLNLQVAFGF
ncbi:MAG: hypothetical protein O2901_15015 [Verrucomicrobia bacterium]|nr:hypothetical protein [Verrucomicrobiota bacterium]